MRSADLKHSRLGGGITGSGWTGIKIAYYPTISVDWGIVGNFPRFSPFRGGLGVRERVFPYLGVHIYVQGVLWGFPALGWKMAVILICIAFQRIFPYYLNK